MKIALVVPGGVSRDGQFNVIPAILWLLERLSARHQVHVVVPWQEPKPGSWDLTGARVWNLGGRRRAWQIRGLEVLLDLHRQHDFDVFQALWASGPGETVVAAARLCRRPSFVHVAGGELVWLPDVPFGNRRRRGLTRRVLRWATRVTAPSRPMIDLVATTSGVAATRVPLGVDTGFWQPEPPKARPRHEPLRIVSVASLTGVKDHAMLLHATELLLRRGHEVTVDLVGLDVSRGRIPELVAELGLARHVTLHGFLPQARAREVVRRAHVMVVCSRHEAGPVAMLEAAAVGVPTVGTPVGHIAEWTPEAATVVAFANPVALRDALQSLLENDDSRLALARRAQERALAEDADWTADCFLSLYEETRRMSR